MGIVLKVENSNITSQEFSYDASCEIPVNEFSTNCTFSGTIGQDMPDSKLFLYYKLTNVYQNHKSFVSSVDPKQLSGEADTCELRDCLSDLVEDDKILIPSGVQAWSYFNDVITVSITRSDEELCHDGDAMNVCTDKSNIALDIEKEHRFVAPEDYLENDWSTREYKNFGTKRASGKVPELSDQSLMVWMRYAATKDFTKLHSVIDTPLKSGDKIEFEIQNNFNTRDFNGKKSFVLSNTSKYGGRHDGLALTFLLSGIICLTLLGVILSVHVWMQRKAILQETQI